ncbi:MAG TPA: class I SAM-dependent methyltransferase, partial [Candidatus Nanoarchaeia archaeon]|nr:class I SAM-dependent methyltransferase [Candidatus Nanoarchaeia archaeon]
LRDDGLFLLQTFGGNRSVRTMDPWIHKYVFPNTLIPSIKQIGAAAEDLFVMEDWHNFGADYDKTIMAWYHNFLNHWPQLQEKYGERFFRMWTYYLQLTAAAFRARKNSLWQIVFSKKGVMGGYVAPR